MGAIQLHRKSLEEASACFYSFRFAEAYNLLRRYFDRLPFRPEEAHAEYIGMFARVLAELGKQHELRFYMGELERLYAQRRTPALGYQLAYVYMYLPEPRMKAAREILDAVLRGPDAGNVTIKAKMTMAMCCDNENDVGACRHLIFSIEEPKDMYLRHLWWVWKAKVLRDEGKLVEAEAMLDAAIQSIDFTVDWYGYFSAKLVLANLHIKRGDRKKASEIAAEIRTLFKGRHCKTVENQIRSLEQALDQKLDLGVLQFHRDKNGDTVVYNRKSIPFKPASIPGKLLLLLAKKRFVKKSDIAELVLSRAYNGREVDKLIHHYIHALRKRLQGIGLPPEAILTENYGYRLVPVVESSWKEDRCA